MKGAEQVLILLLALAWDLLLGEPPSLVHPVVWMGKVISCLTRCAPNTGNRVQFFYGFLTVLVTLGLFAVPLHFLLTYLRAQNSTIFFIVAAFFLKSSFSARELCRVAKVVGSFLAVDELEAARTELRALVGRNTKGLPKPLLISAVVESVAENTSDGFVAPLFYFLIFGVPGAIFYRVTNTLDSMLGYRGRYEYLGKSAARLDDAFNFIPARVTAGLIVLAARLKGKSARASLRTVLQYGSKTPSPNAGSPMAAMAGALGVCLESRGRYKLGEGELPTTPKIIDESLEVTKTSMLMWALTCIVYKGLYLVLAT